jgi:hypothetical protein
LGPSLGHDVAEQIAHALGGHDAPSAAAAGLDLVVSGGEAGAAGSTAAADLPAGLGADLSPQLGTVWLDLAGAF